MAAKDFIFSVVGLTVTAEYPCFLSNRIIAVYTVTWLRNIFLSFLEGLCDHVTEVWPMGCYWKLYIQVSCCAWERKGLDFSFPGYYVHVIMKQTCGAGVEEAGPAFYEWEKFTSVLFNPVPFWVSLIQQLKEFLTNIEVDVKTVLYSTCNLLHITVPKLTVAKHAYFPLSRVLFMHSHFLDALINVGVKSTFSALL